jgi:diguanylate cyclase (GGDEF)-like protein/PAS domain S-box-containing protein
MLLVVASTLPLWLAAGALVCYSYFVKREQAIDRTVESARAIALAVDREVSSVEGALLALATSPAFAARDFATVQRQMTQLTQVYPGVDIIVADATGQQLANSYRPFGQALPKRSVDMAVGLIFADGKPTVSNLFRGAVTGRPLISIDVPVLVDHRVTFDLAMTLPTERLTALLRQYSLPVDWVVVLADAQANIVARTRNPDRYVGAKASPLLVQAAASAREGTLSDVTVDGVKVFSAFSHCIVAGWTVAVGAPQDGLLSESREWLWWTLAGAVLSSLTSVALALAISRRMAKAELELQRYEQIAETTGDMLAFIDRDQRYQLVNLRYADLFGTTQSQIRGMHVYDVMGPKLCERTKPALERALAGELQRQMVERQFADGQMHVLDLEYRPFIGNGAVTGVVANLRDVTERVRADVELRIAAVAFEAQEGIVITDADGVVQRVNRAFTLISGYSAEEMVGLTIEAMQVVGLTRESMETAGPDAALYASFWVDLVRDGYRQGEVWAKRKNGEAFPMWLTVSGVRDAQGRISHYVGTFQDISERKAAEEEIRNLAFFDTLTSLPNRRLLLDRLNQALIASNRTQRHGALMFLDLDHFKVLNDSRGHAAGDLLLAEVAHRLRQCVRQVDTVARLGGDEFVLILDDLSEAQDEAMAQAQAVGIKVLATLNAAYDLAGYEYFCSPSIGVSLFRTAKDPAEELLRRADSAMYRAKALGRNRLCFFDPPSLPDG